MILGKGEDSISLKTKLNRFRKKLRNSGFLYYFNLIFQIINIHTYIL